MSSQLVQPSTRQRLNPRQAETVSELIDAGLAEIRDAGYDGLTVRNVAGRAGVAPATAYTYFSSKDHLVTEVFWRRLQTLEEPLVDRRRSPATRVARVLGDIAAFVAGDPALGRACTVAMLGPDPDVERLRFRIGREFHRRIEVAADGDLDAGAIEAIDLLLSGSLVNAGMGAYEYGELADLLAGASALVVKGASA